VLGYEAKKDFIMGKVLNVKADLWRLEFKETASCRVQRLDKSDGKRVRRCVPTTILTAVLSDNCRFSDSVFPWGRL
jgi:hypothetical protein